MKFMYLYFPLLTSTVMVLLSSCNNQDSQNNNIMDAAKINVNDYSYVLTDSVVRFYESPDRTDNTICLLHCNDSVILLDSNLTNKLVKIKYDNKIGYIENKYIVRFKIPNDIIKGNFIIDSLAHYFNDTNILTYSRFDEPENMSVHKRIKINGVTVEQAYIFLKIIKFHNDLPDTLSEIKDKRINEACFLSIWIQKVLNEPTSATLIWIWDGCVEELEITRYRENVVISYNISID